MGKLQHHPDGCESRAGPDAVRSRLRRHNAQVGESDLHHDGEQTKRRGDLPRDVVQDVEEGCGMARETRSECRHGDR